MIKPNWLPRAAPFFPRLAALGFVVISLAGTPVSADEPVSTAESPALSLDELRSFSDVYNAVRRNYVDPVPDADLLDAALLGMVQELDKYSSYLSPEELRRLDEDASGQYGGIGVTLEIRRQRLIVEDVVEDGPAWIGGVKRGDLILEVDAQAVKGRPLAESMNGLLGAPGSRVTLKVRSGSDQPRDVELTRAYISAPSVRATLVDKDIALLQITGFNRRTAEETEQALVQVTGESGGALSGAIIDLRNNGGGLIQAATLIADGFLDSGLVVYTRGRYAASQMEYFAEPGEWVSSLPLVVLVNGASASASEILAGALQDHGRALIVGSETFGKGTVQSLLHLRNGSGLKLTTARYYTAAGRSFDQTGITPDIVLDDLGFNTGDPEDDAGVQRALALIRDGAAPGAAQPLAAAAP